MERWEQREEHCKNRASARRNTCNLTNFHFSKHIERGNPNKGLWEGKILWKGARQRDKGHKRGKYCGGEASQQTTLKITKKKNYSK